MSHTDLRDLITQTQAAQLRGVTRPAIHSLAMRGRLRLVEIAGKPFVFRSEVLALKTQKSGGGLIRTDETLINDVVRVANEVGHLPTSTEYKRHGSINLSVVCNRFGGWSGVIKAARRQKGKVAEGASLA